MANSVESAGILSADARDPVCVRVRIERRNANAGAGREDEGDMRPVDDETRGPLVDAGLKEMGGLQFAGRRVQHREESADGDVRADVRGAVERIDRDQQRSVGVDRDRIGAFL